ncbi:MAG: hypothetical protein ACK568_09625 [Pseudanabaena sp.]
MISAIYLRSVPTLNLLTTADSFTETTSQKNTVKKLFQKCVSQIFVDSIDYYHAMKLGSLGYGLRESQKKSLFCT